MTLLTPVLFLIAIFGFLAGGYFTLKLALETKKEKYWYFFTIAAFAMGIHQIAELFAYLNFIPDAYELQFGLLLHAISGLSIAYASYGIVKMMVEIKRKV